MSQNYYFCGINAQCSPSFVDVCFSAWQLPQEWKIISWDWLNYYLLVCQSMWNAELEFLWILFVKTLLTGVTYITALMSIENVIDSVLKLYAWFIWIVLQSPPFSKHVSVLVSVRFRLSINDHKPYVSFASDATNNMRTQYTSNVFCRTLKNNLPSRHLDNAYFAFKVVCIVVELAACSSF